MPQQIQVNDQITIPPGEIEVTTMRSSGPGGQHVNTSDTRIRLRWNLTDSAALSEVERKRAVDNLGSRLSSDGDLIVTCGKHRSQRRNRQECMDRLAAILRRALTPPRTRRKTRVPSAARERRLQDKKKRAALKRSRGRRDDQD